MRKTKAYRSYFEPELQHQAKIAAAIANIPLSHWIAEAIREKLLKEKLEK